MSRLNTTERKTIKDLKDCFRNHCKNQSCKTCDLAQLGDDCFKSYVDTMLSKQDTEKSPIVTKALTITNLKKSFNEAMRDDKYLGIAKQLEGQDAPEITIIPPTNLEDKLKFILMVYDNHLRLNSNKNIKIIGFKVGEYCELSSLLNSPLR